MVIRLLISDPSMRTKPADFTLDQTIGFYQPFLMHTLSKLRERYSPNVDQIVEFLCLSLLFTNEPDSLRNAEAYWNDHFVKAIHVLVPQGESIRYGSRCDHYL